MYVTIKDNVYKVPVFNGTGYLDVGKLPGGIYNYSALFEGTNVFIKSIVNGTFEVPSINLEVPYLVKYYSSSDKLVAILTDGLGNPIVGKNVTFCINNVNYTRVTDNEGKASMGIGLIPGIYNVTASYENITVKSGITSLYALAIAIPLDAAIPLIIVILTYLHINLFYLIFNIK